MVVSDGGREHFTCSKDRSWISFDAAIALTDFEDARPFMPN